MPVAGVCAIDEKAGVSVEGCDGSAKDADDSECISGVASEVNGSSGAGDCGTSQRRIGRRVADRLGPRRDNRGSEDDKEGEAGTSDERKLEEEWRAGEDGEKMEVGEPVAD